MNRHSSDDIGRRVGHGRRRQVVGVGRIGTADCVQERGGVAHAARDHVLDEVRVGDRQGRRPSAGRLQPDHPAPRGRQPDRAADVAGVERQLDKPANRSSSRRSVRGAAAPAPGVPWAGPVVVSPTVSSCWHARLAEHGTQALSTHVVRDAASVSSRVDRRRKLAKEDAHD